MRIILKLSKNTEPIPFNHLQYLVGALHKWIGKQNGVHGDMSLYSFSWLKGTTKFGNGLQCNNGASWYISTHDDLVLKQIITGIQEDPNVCFGMKVQGIVLQETPAFENSTRFVLGSPIFIKARIEGQKHQKHYIFKDSESETIMTDILKKKLEIANLNASGVKVYFDKEFYNPKTKNVNYRGIENIANMCPVIIEGTPEQIGFAWNVGIGHSTGIGFGALN
jgi:CRISPR-associated endoribonuclease Cas6